MTNTTRRVAGRASRSEVRDPDGVRLLLTPEAAYLAGMTDTHLRRHLKVGSLNGRQYGRTWMVREDDLHTWLDSRR